MREKLKSLAIWYLQKYYPVTIKNISIDSDNISVNFAGHISDDNDWHNAACTISVWVKRNQKELMIDELAVWDGGELKSRFLFERGVTYDALSTSQE